MVEVMQSLQPKVFWQFQLDGDWQPYTLGASAAVEARHALWVAGRGPSIANERSAGGQLEYSVNFATMKQQSSSTGVERVVRREELFARETVAALLEQLAAAEQAAERAAARGAAAERRGVAREANLGICCGADGEHRDTCCGEGRSRSSSGDRLAAAAGAAAEDAADAAGAATARSSSSEASLVAKAPALPWQSSADLSDRLFALPSHMIAKPCEITPLVVGDPRRQWLERYFRSSFEQHRRSMYDGTLCPRAEVDIAYVLEVYNPMAVKSYRHELSQMTHKWGRDCEPVAELGRAVAVRTDLGGPRLNETLLFHGTSWSSSTEILNEGFDSRLAGLHAGAAFGAGTYFTPTASKADLYTRRLGDSAMRREGDPRQRVVIVGRVALGQAHEATQYSQNLRRPPLSSEGMPLDSVVGLPSSRGGVLDFPEVVVYKPGQAVPQFVICYKHRLECKCRTCVNPLK